MEHSNQCAMNYAIQPGKKLSLFYDMTIPVQLNPSTAFTNTAHVLFYTTAERQDDKVLPADNITDLARNRWRTRRNFRTTQDRVGGTSVATDRTTSGDAKRTAIQLEQATVGETIATPTPVTIGRRQHCCSTRGSFRRAARWHES